MVTSSIYEATRSDLQTSVSAERRVHLQAAFSKARGSALLQLHLKEAKRDGFLKHRA